MEFPLRSLVENWISQVEAGLRVKENLWGKYAREAYQFFNGDPNCMWNAMKAKKFTDEFGQPIDGMIPDFQIQVNRLLDLVTLVGPALFHKYPDFDIQPQIPPSPFDDLSEEELTAMLESDPAAAEQFTAEQQTAQSRRYCARIKSHYLNWLQPEAGKKEQAKLVITETLIKGMGIMWTEMHRPPGSSIQYPLSYFISVDDYVCDPDARKKDGINWIAIRRRETVATVLEKFPDLTKDQLKGHFQSIRSQQTEQGKREIKENRGGESFDIVEYWEIYSKQGFGDDLKWSDQGRLPKPAVDTAWLGKFCRIVVANGIHFPLNLPPQAMSAQSGEEEILKRVAWPIPFYYDGGWPFTPLAFYEDTDTVWPIGLGRNAVGLLKFMNWILSFMADKVAITSRDVLGIVKSAATDLENQISRKRFGPFLSFLIDKVHGEKISDVVSYIQGPEFKADLWRVYTECVEMFEKITGLTDLAYGISNVGIRSASEFEGRNARVNIRSDDMAATVEDWLEAVACKEMQAICALGQFEDFAKPVGEHGAAAILEYIASAGQESVLRDFNFRIVSGSSRKPNKDARKQEVQQIVTILASPFQAQAAAGDPGPMNWLIRQVAETYEFDARGALFKEPAQGADPAELQAQQMQMQMEQEAQLKQQQLAIDSEMAMQEHGQQMAEEQSEHDLKLRHAEEEHRLKLRHQADLLVVAKKKAEMAARKPPARSGSSSGRAGSNGKATRS